MNPWITFFIGLFTGSAGGLLVAVLCIAARGNDEEESPQDSPSDAPRGCMGAGGPACARVDESGA